MKKIYIAVAALAAVTLFSCQQEQSFNDEKLGENTLVLSLQGAPSTRSMETNATIKKGETFYFKGDYRRCLINEKEKECRLIWISTAPIF